MDRSPPKPVHMAGKLFLPEEIYRYLLAASLREHPLLRRLREENVGHPHESFQIPPEHGQFMQLLIKLMGARNTVEIGVFTGYSSLAVALALPEDGKIVACDINQEYTSIARQYWREAGVEHKIDLRLKPALETLDGLIKEGRSGTFDFAFIDADKSNYGNYYERCLDLLRPGGLIMADNVIWSGRVCDPADRTVDTEALRAFNKKVGADERVTMSMLPVGDGIILALKR